MNPPSIDMKKGRYVKLLEFFFGITKKMYIFAHEKGNNVLRSVI